MLSSLFYFSIKVVSAIYVYVTLIWDSNLRLGVHVSASSRLPLASAYCREAGAVVFDEHTYPSGVEPEQTALRVRASSKQTPMPLRSVSKARKSKRVSVVIPHQVNGNKLLLLVHRINKTMLTVYTA